MKLLVLGSSVLLLLLAGCSRADSNSASNNPADKATENIRSNPGVLQQTNTAVAVKANRMPSEFSIPAVKSQGEGGEHTRALMAINSNGQPMVSGSKAGAGFQYDMSSSLSSPFGGSMVPSYWCVGAEQVFEGKFEAGPGLIFDSEKDYRLSFKLIKEKGLVYLCGRGTVTTPDGKTTRLGYDDTIDTWIPLLNSKDALLREAASQALGDLAKTPREKETVVPKLIEILKDDEFQIRRSAAESLGKLGDKRAIEALTARSSDNQEKDEWVRKVVVEALDKIKNQTQEPQADKAVSQNANAQAAGDEKYRDLKREDGVNFGAYIDKMAFSFGGAPSGTLTKFGLVDSGGKFYELELDSKEFNNGEIKTKLLGVVRAQSSGATSMSYALTESQIKKARAYLDEQKGK